MFLFFFLCVPQRPPRFGQAAGSGLKYQISRLRRGGDRAIVVQAEAIFSRNAVLAKRHASATSAGHQRQAPPADLAEDFPPGRVLLRRLRALHRNPQLLIRQCFTKSVHSVLNFPFSMAQRAGGSVSPCTASTYDEQI